MSSRVALLVLLSSCATAPPSPSPPAPWPALEQSLAVIAAREDGIVGAAVIHLPSGRSAVLHGDDRFLMASVYKLPIALALLDAADHGQLSLAERVTIGKDDISPGAQPPLGGAFTGSALSLPLSRLLHLMIANSDNSATDVILRRLGGPPVVGAYLRRVGHGDIRVDRSTRDLYTGPDPVSADSLLVGHDPRDTTTPIAMARLLAALARQEVAPQQVATDASRNSLLEIMSSPGVQKHRLQPALPPGTPVAQKSGTAQALATNAVGIVTLPPPHGQLAIAVFVSASHRPVAHQEQTIAALARAAYDAALR
jgi:beta-lactamase class A